MSNPEAINEYAEPNEQSQDVPDSVAGEMADEVSEGDAEGGSQQIGNTLLKLAEIADGRAGDVLRGMTSQDAFDYLQELNQSLCEIPHIENAETATNSERLFRNGERKCIAPDRRLQEILFKEYFEVIQNDLEDKDEQALLAYYAINNLHLFPSNNEVMARVVFLWLKNGASPNLDKIKTLNEDEFLSEYSIWPVESMNKKANTYLQDEMINNNTLLGRKYGEVTLLDKAFDGKRITIESVKYYRNLVYPMMSGKDKTNLGRDGFEELQYALSDESGGGKASSSLAGLAMASTFSNIGVPKVIKDACNNSDSRNCLKIYLNYDNDDSEEVGNTRAEMTKQSFADWGPSTSRYACDMYRKLKRAQNETIIRFFTEKTAFYGDKTIVDAALGR